MSVLAAIFDRFGGPVDERAVNALLVPVADRTPDGTATCAMGHVGLAYGALHTLPEARATSQPCVDVEARLRLSFVGRVDNRSELCEAVGLSTNVAESDASLVLRAYRALGESFVERIVGDFALVLWDGVHQKLLCARDPFGSRALFYFVRPDLFVCASEIAQLLSHPRASRRPNESAVARFLARVPIDEQETLYSDIARVVPGQLLVVTRTTLRARRFWSFADAPRVRFRRRSDYVERFQELFDVAVTSRLCSDLPIAAQVSGGIDSSSVFVSACALLGPTQARERLRPYALHFPGRPACDEGRFVDAVERAMRMPVRRFEPDRLGPAPLGTVARTCELPENPIFQTYREADSYVKAEGCRVVLTGDGGDDWFGGNTYQYADMLREGQLFTLLRQARSEHASWWDPALRQNVRDYALRPLVPRLLRNTVRAARALRGSFLVPPLVGRDLAYRVGLLPWYPAPRRIASSYEIDTMIVWTCDSRTWQSVESFEAASARQGFERRAPFQDRRLVEYILGVPRELRWHGRLSKSLVRASLAHRLPPEILAREDKGEFSHVVLADVAARQLVQGGLTGLASRGWIDAAAAKECVSLMWRLNAQGDWSYLSLIWTAWLLFAIEEWGAWLGDV